MTTERVLRDIPESNVDEVIRSFESQGCTAAKEPQDNGRWTVRAQCPDD